MLASHLPSKLHIPVFGQKIAYYDTGSGPAVVLVHGFDSEARFDWGHVLLPLAENYRVVALDQVGFGSSEKPSLDYCIQTFVDFLGEFLRTLGIYEFTLAGESFGGWVSALYTIQSLAPDNTGPLALPSPQRLILEDAAGLVPLPPHPPLAMVFHDKSRVTEEFIRDVWGMKIRANDGSTEHALWGNPKTSTEVVSSRLAIITVPTLVVWGDSDEVIPLAQGRAYAEGIPGAKLSIIAECGHAPSIERPAEFLAAVLPFIQGS